MKEANEIGLSITDMFWTVMKKWRSMVSAMVIGAVVIGGIGYTKNVREYQAKLVDEVNTEEIDEELFMKNLDPEEVEKVEYTATVIAQLHQLYMEQEEYNKNSIIMQENPSAVPMVTLRYYIDNHYEVEYPLVESVDNIDSIIQAYAAVLSDDALYQKMSDAFGNQLDESYYSELLTVLPQERGFEIQITHYNERNCKKISQIVKTYIEEQYENIYNAIDEKFEITLLAESYQKKAKISLVNIKKENVNQLINIRVAETNLKGALSENEQAYYEYLINEKNNTVDSNLQMEDSDRDIVLEKPSVNIKHVIIGAFLGIIFVIGWTGLMYILDRRLHTSNDLCEMYDLEMISTIITDSQKKRRILGYIDKFMLQLRYRGRREFSLDEYLKMTISAIKLCLQEQKCSHILFTGCAWSEFTVTLIDKMKEELIEAGICVYCEPDMVYNAESMMTLQKVGGVFLVETVGNTTYEDADREINICRQGKVPILGVIMIQPE